MRPEGPTVILVGGELVLETGERIDTRQSITGDKWDFISRAALVRSEAWWLYVHRLASVILAESTDPAWALVWGPKTVQRPQSDGTFKRRRMLALLGDADSLMDGRFSVEGSNSLLDVGRSAARYRLLEYPLRYQDLQAAEAPAVFLGGFHESGDFGWEMLSLLPLDQVLKRWPSTTLVLPHTPTIEAKVQSLLQWWSAEMPELGQISERASAAYMKAKDGYVHHRLDVLSADLSITFFIDRGIQRSAEDLTAALDFVSSRYDLQVGLWDLARDPLLRATVLDPEPPQIPSRRARRLPSEAVQAVGERTARHSAMKQSEEAARTALHEDLWPYLGPRGWIPNQWRGPGSSYSFDLAQRVVAPDGKAVSPVNLYFEIYKNQAVLRFGAITRTESSDVFLRENSAGLEAITGQEPEPDQNVLIRLPGHGWSNLAGDWQKASSIFEEVARYLHGRIGTLVEEATQIVMERSQWMADRAPIRTELVLQFNLSADDSGVIGIESMQVESSEPSGERSKKGLWGRLIGRS